MGIFHTVESSRKELFPGFTAVASDTLRLDSAAAAKAKALLGKAPEEKAVVFERLALKDGGEGYVYRGRERGKVELMDFAVGLDAQGRVQRVLLTAYRESIGGEVGSKRFMGQFQGKDAAKPPQFGRGIDGISGATISSRAVTVGVRKAVCYWKVKYGKA